jgi:negative regulator of flagellin synthesis FlgM
MKIGSLDAKPVLPAPGPERKAATPAAGAAAGAAESSAKVALSSEAKLLVKVADDPAFDAQKVERIAAAIREGKFQVNPEAIADKLIVNAAELLGRKPS